ncbi:MAG TPA: aminoacyl-tRNA hydrolase [Casimicrobiaceae bacterium]|jgi:peptidyl-tRNA hydrolase, PTH1 family|nr:aminoacyl-tRNA hydrolase [Casimicrobiaceae bacterium]
MTPLRLIVGIGNPGSEYRATRHNAGAWFVERLAQAVGASLGMQAKFQALVASVRANDGIDRRLALPQTFVNRSGQAVSALARFYRIAPEEILIAHDELDLKPGAVKLKEGGGSAGHNGLKDIAASLGTPAFWRLRIGIGHPREGALSEQEVADYVLHRPRLEEQQAIDDAIVRALAIWPSLEVGDTERAMHLLHTVPKAPKAPQATEAGSATASNAPDSRKPPAPAASSQDSADSSEEKGPKAK